MHFGSEQGSAYLPRNRVCVWEMMSSLDPLRAASHVRHVHLLSMLTRVVASHVICVHLLSMLIRNVTLLQGSTYLARNRVCVWEMVSSLDVLREASTLNPDP